MLLNVLIVHPVNIKQPLVKVRVLIVLLVIMLVLIKATLLALYAPRVICNPIAALMVVSFVKIIFILIQVRPHASTVLLENFQ